MADAVVPRYKVDAQGDLVPDLRAAAAIIYNPVNNQVLWEENSQDQRSIASITKMMTAVVFMETNPDLNAPVTVTRQDTFQASTTHIRVNDQLTADEVCAWQLTLRERGLSFSTYNTHSCALRFFFRVTVKSPFDVEMIPHARTPLRLPVVLSPEEVHRFLCAVPHVMHRMALVTA